MKNIKVSVIIPSLNVVSYIRQCLDSVRIQTLQELEIVCVDAGSTDGTLAVINEFIHLDNRIRLVESRVKSYGYQMNLGISNAVGEYIGIVEPDDYIAEEMFERLYLAACESQLDFVKSNFYKFMDYMERRHYQKWDRTVWVRGKEKSFEFPYKKVILLKENKHAMVYGDHGNIWSGIYRREFLLNKEIRFHETPGASYQDTGFALICSLEAERVMFLEDAFYRYRQNNAGSSVSSQEKHSTIIEEYRWIWEQMKIRGLTDEISRSFYMVMKFHSYLWNYNRLTTDNKHKFLENLKKDEMFDFDERLISYIVPEKEKMLDLWRGNWYEAEAVYKREEEQRKYIKEILEVFNRASQIVVVSAGAYGMALLRLEDGLGTGKVCAVCDNALSVQGRCVEGREVVSVRDAVYDFPNAHYVIANKYHAEEIYAQISGLGVVEERIVTCRTEVYVGNGIMNFLLWVL